MPSQRIRNFCIVAVLAALSIHCAGPKPAIDSAQPTDPVGASAGKVTTTSSGPLKVYILSGQSNMQGKAQVRTLPHMAKDPASKALHDKIIDENGTPRVHENVSIVYYTGGGGKKGKPRIYSEKQGALTVGFGGEFGPELAFGITAQEIVNEPILIIKTAWGGKSLNYDFRPPSAGPQPMTMSAKEWEDQLAAWKAAGTHDEEIAKLNEAISGDDNNGWYYREMMKRVKEVLADPGKYSKHYDPKQGYKIAGFAWFQGFNDGIAPYPKADPKARSRRAPKDYSEYSRLLACFIRDVRKELDAPRMPFVIGVIGVGGEKATYAEPFRKAMAAPADMPEFKGNVAAVRSSQFWDDDIDEAVRLAGLWKKQSHRTHTRDTDGALQTSASADVGWVPVGTPAPQERQWRYTSFSIDPEKHYRPLREGEEGDIKVFTEEVPDNLKGWNTPGFDDSAWQKGLAPIGKGEWKQGKKGVVKNRALWGDGNMLLMRTTFDAKDLDAVAYRISSLNKESYHAYLNGNKFRMYVWYYGRTDYRTRVMTEEITPHLKEGTNVLAVYTKTDQKGVNSVDFIIDSMSKENKARMDGLQDETYPPKYREIAKGIGSQGYHYYGSAKIYSNTGEALAKALLQLDGAR